jgi:hypothetical protein
MLVLSRSLVLRVRHLDVVVVVVLIHWRFVAFFENTIDNCSNAEDYDKCGPFGFIQQYRCSASGIDLQQRAPCAANTQFDSNNIHVPYIQPQVSCLSFDIFFLFVSCSHRLQFVVCVCEELCR